MSLNVDSTRSLLDCSRPRVWLAWFCLGALQVLALQALVVWVHGEGNWAWLLQVGAEKPLKHQIQAELGPVSHMQPLGHDGEMFYVIARDPLASEPKPPIGPRPLTSGKALGSISPKALMCLSASWIDGQ